MCIAQTKTYNSSVFDLWDALTTKQKKEFVKKSSIVQKEMKKASLLIVDDVAPHEKDMTYTDKEKQEVADLQENAEKYYLTPNNKQHWLNEQRDKELKELRQDIMSAERKIEKLVALISALDFRVSTLNAYIMQLKKPQQNG